MKKTLILLLGLALLVCLAGGAVAEIIAHPKYSAPQKATMLQAVQAELKRLNSLDPNGKLIKDTIAIPQYRVGDISSLSPAWGVSVFRVIDEWNCILSVSHSASSNTSKIFVWLEDYSTADLFTDDVVQVLGKFRVVEGEHVTGMPAKARIVSSSTSGTTSFSDTENPREMKIRVVRLLSPDEVKNPIAYEALEAKEKARRAEAAGNEDAKDKALRRPWTIGGNREWAIFDGVRGGQVVLRFTRVHPGTRDLEYVVKTHPMKSLSKEDQVWVEEMMKK
jgi:hypothetical protein